MANKCDFLSLRNRLVFLSGLRSAIFPRQSGGRKRIKPVFLPEDLPRCTDAACSPFLLLLSLPFRGELSSMKLTKDLFYSSSLILLSNIIFKVKANFISSIEEKALVSSCLIFLKEGIRVENCEDVQ